MPNRTWLTAAVAATVLVAGCSTPDSRPERSNAQVTAPDTPEGTLTELVKRIADGRADNACELFVPGGQAIFAQQFETTDCVSAMQIVIGKVTDPKNFGSAQLKPSGKYPGVQLDGDSATFGGACSGWRDPDLTSGMAPSDLGEIKLKKTPNGWFIYEVRLPNTTCGG